MVESQEIDNNKNNMDDDFDDSHSLGTLKAGDIVFGSLTNGIRNAIPSQSNASETVSPRTSWADMAQEDGLKEEEHKESDTSLSIGDSMKTPEKRKLSREQREQFRFTNVKKMKVFSCFEKVKGQLVNILEGLELHTGVFSAVEQKRIVDHVYELQEKGRKGELQG